MKLQTSIKISTLLGLTLLLTACPVKNRPRQVHEQAPTWTPTHTPVDESVSASAFATVDLKAAYSSLNSPDAANKSKSVLDELSRIVLNGKFVESPKFRTTKMREMINVFHRAFLNVLDKKDSSKEIADLKTRYYATINAGCGEDFRLGCINLDLFREEPHFSRIMVRLAQEFDAPLETELANFKNTDKSCVKDSQVCRDLLYARYRRLAMATGKRNAYADSEYAFSYLKHARVFAELIQLDRQNKKRVSYLAEVHGKIFETIIAKFDPKNIPESEFKQFVEDFGPLTFSLKEADLFERGTEKMFAFYANCCLYKDKAKTELSESAKNSIKKIQGKKDELGESFHQKVLSIHQRNPAIFKNLGLENEVARLLDLNSSFYEEHFFVVDRLFRWHLRPEQVNMILNNSPFKRTEERFAETIEIYAKVYLIDMVLYTNEFMNNIYNRKIDSNKLFNVVAAESTELTSKWHFVQQQTIQLERAMVGYFRARNAYTAEIDKKSRVLKGINRNVHYLSVYPNMMVMTYFLTKGHGSVEVPLPWRDTPLQLNAGTVLATLYDGDMDNDIRNVWYKFGIDLEPITRPMLLYSFDYLLKTNALGTFQNDRAKFFEQLFSKYMEDPLYKTRKKVLDMNRDVYNTNNYQTMRKVCDYELGIGPAPDLRMPLTSLANYTYAGIGEKAFVNESLLKSLTAPNDIIGPFRAEIDSRIVFVRSMIDIIEKDLKRRNLETKDHAETKAGYEVLKQLEDLRYQVSSHYIQSHKYYFNCAIRLKEIERRRMNRLFDEERKHLNKIFDLLAPLTEIKDPALKEAAIKDINLKYFRDKDNNYRFDEFNGTSYVMSKYDLLTRMKRLVMSNVFLNQTKREDNLYGKDVRYLKPRFITIDDVDKLDSLVRDSMIQDRLSKSIQVTGNSEADRKAFVDQAMLVMAGQKDSYISWYEEQKSADFDNYISLLLELYFQGPIESSDGKVLKVTARDVIKAYTRAQASYGLDEIDVENALQFGSEGPRTSTVFYRDRLFNGNGQRLAFYYKFMLEALGRSGTMLDVESEKLTAGSEALKFAINEITLREDAQNENYAPGSLIFEPNQDTANSIRTQYGDRANGAYQLTFNLFKELKNIKADLGDMAYPNTLNAEIWNLDPSELRRLDLPIYIEEKQPIKWYDSKATWVDETRRDNQIFMINDFVRRTGDFYKTKEKVKKD